MTWYIMGMEALYTLKYMLCLSILGVIILKKINDLHEKRNEEEQKAMNTSKQNMQKLAKMPKVK